MKSWIWLVLAAGAVGGGYWYWTKHAKCTTCASTIAKSPAQSISQPPRGQRTPPPGRTCSAGQILSAGKCITPTPGVSYPAYLTGARPENPFLSKQSGSSGQFVPKQFGLKRGV